MHKIDETALTAVAVVYTNWRGETAEREIRPKRMWFGSTEWHPEPQWLITAVDVQKGVERDFALSGFGRAALPPETALAAAVSKRTLYRCDTCPEEMNCHPACDMFIVDSQTIACVDCAVDTHRPLAAYLAALPPEAVLSVPAVVEVKPLAWLRRVSTKWGDGPDEYTGDVALADMWRSHPNTFDVTPLYAAPSPQPATAAVEARG